MLFQYFDVQYIEKAVVFLFIVAYFAFFAPGSGQSLGPPASPEVLSLGMQKMQKMQNMQKKTRKPQLFQYIANQNAKKQ